MKGNAIALACALLLLASCLPGQSSAAPPQPGRLADTVSAPPLKMAGKFKYAIADAFGLPGFGGAAVSAALGQWEDSPQEWGQGFSGYAKRYASGFAGTFTLQTLTFGLESALHEDPRYFPSRQTGFKHRFWNAVEQTFFCKTDSGATQFAYAGVIGDFANGELVNAWQPPSTTSFGHGIERGFISLGVAAGFNFVQEFFPFTRPASIRHRH
ncbi:MAG: hypothetical protein ACRD45_19430 [Bryobacteraceae bacterium]